MDENGDAAGNYTILSAKLLNKVKVNSTNTYGLFPIGTFITRLDSDNGSQNIPVSEGFYVWRTFAALVDEEKN